MSNYVTGTSYNSNTGFFEITSTSTTGETTTQSVNFTTLCMIFSLTSLNAQDEVFATQFEEAQAQVNTLTMINDCMQMLNTYSGMDDSGTTTLNSEDMDAWLNVYYPELVLSGIVQDGDGSSSVMGIGSDGVFYKSELDTIMENLRSAQSTVSSQNEQQMLLTNDAASKRSTILQLAQSLLQEASDARKTASQTK